MTFAYEIALDRSFRQVVITGRPHPMFRSSFIPSTELSPNTRYYWRARAYNTKVCASVGDFSPPQSFITGGQE